MVALIKLSHPFHTHCIFLLLLQACLQLPLHVCGTSRAMVEAEAPQPQSSNSAVFREYIGGGGAALSDVPINKSVEFHFLLAFAVDEAPPNSLPAGPTNGNFSAFWQPRLSPANIREIKANYSNVKVAMSLGGAGPVFSPITVSSWVNNAVTSLTQIIQDYSLDGIDIDYENFTSTATVADFATCIGELITELKNRNLISMASIAPYPNTDSYYTELWQNYSSMIDFVNYQFYSDGDISATEYSTLYENAKAMYTGGKVIPSFETISNGTQIVPSTGLQACKTIKDAGDLQGIFIWSADQSYPDFQFETQAQALLVSS